MKSIKKKNDELEYLPVSPTAVSVVINENVYEELPKIIKFTENQIILSIFQNSNKFETGYENRIIEILDGYYLEDGDYRVTILITDGGRIRLSQNLKNPNIYYLEGIYPSEKLTLIRINDNTFNQILNLRTE